MHATSHHCPHCGIKLRIRDRMFVGMQVGCPECGRPLRIRADGPQGLAIEPGEAVPPQPSAARRAAAAAEPGKRPRPLRRTEQAPVPPGKQTTTPEKATGGQLSPPPAFSASAGVNNWRQRLRSPTVISWAVAGTVAAVLLMLFASSGENRSQQNAAEAAVTDQKPAETLREIAPDNLAPRPAEADTAATRLAALGRSLNSYRDGRGHFPAAARYADGLPPDQRFSWLAELDAAADGSNPPLWNQPWDHSLNDRFVRRSVPAFQNPALTERIGASGYPAAHFAGVAGIGPDAPGLPADHPRAGVFGTNRKTRLDDIRDGAANTIAVAGVNGELGPWAAAGHGTVRPLTAEPYINGPDGFGTGQTDGMNVLMADGSVRFIARETDPTIIRRMAAMADGLPLDSSVPGEPGEDRLLPAAAASPAADVAVAERPLVEAIEEQIEPGPPVVPAAPVEPVPPIDVAAQLALPIVRFEQQRPVTVRELLTQLEEMAAVPIVFEPAASGDEPAELDAQVSLTLKKSTVGEILAQVLAEAGLTYRVENNRIHVIRE